MSEEPKLPIAVWSGEIMGMKVHVLDDGRRIIDADDLAAFFDRMNEDGVEAMLDQVAELQSFITGTLPMPEKANDK